MKIYTHFFWGGGGNIKCSSINICRRKNRQNKLWRQLKYHKNLQRLRQENLNKSSDLRMPTFPRLLKYSVSRVRIYYTSINLRRLVIFTRLWNKNRTPTEFKWNSSFASVTEQLARHPRNRGSMAGWYKKFLSIPKYPFRFCGPTS